ncbi:YegJ family protein [Ectopseudomonas khazarica]|uniref:YegJ family protein n=1 Tax=Ectopseudomonas khazarica TaxID=2502979 RepID=UPI0037CCC2FD
MRIQLVSALCALSLTALGVQARDTNEVVTADRQDAAIAAAVREAQRTLDDFLQLAAAPPAGTQGFRVQVMVEDEHGIETFWITHFRVLDQGFVGEVANEPRVVKSVTWGQQLRFSREQITDWGYLRNGRQVGSFTVCALFKQMPAEQAAYYREEHGFDC